MGKVMTERVAVCKELDIIDEKTLYYPIEEKVEEIFIVNSYLFRECIVEETKTVSAIYVEDIIDVDQEMKVEDTKGVCFRKVDNEFVFSLEEEAIQEYKNANVKQFKKELKYTLAHLKLLIKYHRIFVCKERKKYLIDTYFGVPADFEKHGMEARNRWLQEANGTELDLYYGINIWELKRKIESFISDNDVIINIDKTALRCYCLEALDHVLYSIEHKRNARMQMDDYLGVHVEDKSKDLVWGYRTPYPIIMGFSFFWGLVKNILSLTYVPAIFVLLDNEYKIPIYIMLSMVYLISLVFSDEKQMDKLLCNASKIISYERLYYSGLMISITFILFSIEMVSAPSKDICVVTQYLLIGVVVAYCIILLFNTLMAIMCWIITMCRATRFYRKRWKKVKCVTENVIKIVIYVLGVISLANILEISKYMSNENTELPWQCWVFLVVLMTSVLRICVLCREMFTHCSLHE